MLVIIIILFIAVAVIFVTKDMQTARRDKGQPKDRVPKNTTQKDTKL